jgi:hypothetical protein
MRASGRSFCWRLGVTGIEKDLSFKLRAQHVEQAIGNAAQRACMTVAPRAQRRIALAADRIVRNGDPRPMIECGLRSHIANMALDRHATRMLSPQAGRKPGEVKRSTGPDPERISGSNTYCRNRMRTLS